MKKIVTSLAILILNLNTYSQTGNWELLNPKPTVNDILKIIFTSKKTGFIITGREYAYTYKAGNSELVYTNDGGNSWQVIKELESAADISINGNDGVIVGNYGQVMRTKDGGKTWYEIPFDQTHYVGSSQNASCYISNDTIYLTRANYFYRSYDEGNSWIETRMTTSRSQEVIEFSYFLNSKVGHLFFSKGSIFKTVDGGNNWYETESSTTTPSNFVNVFFVNDSIAYASQEHFNFFKTTDGGESWTDIGVNSKLARAFHFFDENTGCIAGNYGTIYQTDNGGIVWKLVELPDSNTSSQELNSMYFLDDSVGYCVGNEGIIYKTINGGKNWELNSNLFKSIENIYFTSDSIGYLKTYSSIYKTHDKGISWVKLNLPYAQRLYNIHFFNNDTGIVSASQEKLFKTYNGGVNWNTIKPVTFNQNIESMYFIDKDTGFISGDYNGSGKFVLISKDGGETWTKTQSTYSFDQLFFLDSKKGYGLRLGDLYSTRDGGNNWIKIDEVDGDLTEIEFVNNTVGYISSEQGILFKTVNGGDNWQELKTEFGHAGLDFINENIGFIISYSIFTTYNGGKTWEEFKVPKQINEISIAPNNMIYAIGSGGMILKDTLIIKETVTTTEVNDKLSSIQKMTLSIYPNPVKNILYIKSNETVEELLVYDYTGRVLLIQKCNNNKIECDLSNLTSGIYFINLIIKKENYFERFIKY